jgi:hypothetical protein
LAVFAQTIRIRPQCTQGFFVRGLQRLHSGAPSLVRLMISANLPHREHSACRAGSRR